MEEFDVYFPQVNYTCIRVTAKDRKSASIQAMQIWVEDYQPLPIDVKERGVATK